MTAQLCAQVWSTVHSAREAGNWPLEQKLLTVPPSRQNRTADDNESPPAAAAAAGVHFGAPVAGQLRSGTAAQHLAEALEDVGVVVFEDAAML